MSGIVGKNSGRGSGIVGTAALGADAVGLAEMAGGTDGNIISYDASGDPVAIATGDDGQVLTSTGAGSPPAFEAAAGGGSWTLIGTQAASNDASLTQTGLSSTYDLYAVAWSDIFPETEGVLNLRLGDSSGIDSGASDYSWTHTLLNHDSTSYGAQSDASDSEMSLTATIGNATGEGGSGLVFIGTPGDATGYPKVFGNGCYLANNAVGCGILFSGFRIGVITVDRVQLIMSSDNITSGRMTVWGVSHA